MSEKEGTTTPGKRFTRPRYILPGNKSFSNIILHDFYLTVKMPKRLLRFEIERDRWSGRGGVGEKSESHAH